MKNRTALIGLVQEITANPDLVYSLEFRKTVLRLSTGNVESFDIDDDLTGLISRDIEKEGIGLYYTDSEGFSHWLLDYDVDAIGNSRDKLVASVRELRKLMGCLKRLSEIIEEE